MVEDYLINSVLADNNFFFKHGWAKLLAKSQSCKQSWGTAVSTFPHVTAEEEKVPGLKRQAKFPSSSDSSAKLNSEFGQLS